MGSSPSFLLQIHLKKGFTQPLIKTVFFQPLLHKIHSQNSEVIVSPWTKKTSSQTQAFQRVLTYSTTLFKSLGQDKASVREFQTYCDDEEGHLVILSKCLFEGMTAHWTIERRLVRGEDNTLPAPARGGDLHPKTNQNKVTLYVTMAHGCSSDILAEKVNPILAEGLMGSMKRWVDMARETVIDHLHTNPAKKSISPSYEYYISLKQIRNDLICLQDQVELTSKTLKSVNSHLEQNKINYDQLLLEDAICNKVQQTFSQYMAGLEILSLKQKEEEEKSKRKQLTWAFAFQELQNRLRTANNRIQYPVLLLGNRSFILVLAFLVMWPIVVRNIWNFFGTRWIPELIKFFDSVHGSRTSRYR